MILIIVYNVVVVVYGFGHLISSIFVIVVVMLLLVNSFEIMLHVVVYILFAL